MDVCRADPPPRLIETGQSTAAVACWLPPDVRDREGARLSGQEQA